MDFRELVTASGLALRNTAGSFLNTFASTATANRTITLQDKDYTLAGLNDTHLASPKTTPVDADELSLYDSAASFNLKSLTISNLKALLKNYFDTLYQAKGTAISWTPSIAYLTPGAGATITGKYSDNDGIVHFSLRLDASASTTVTAGQIPILTLPLATTDPLLTIMGELLLYDANGVMSTGVIVNMSATTVALYVIYCNTNYAYIGGIQAGIPITIAAGDILTIHGRYRKN